MDFQVGEFLKNLRRKENISLREASKLSGIPHSTIHGYEQNEVDPPTSKFLKLCEIYHVNPRFLELSKEYICIDDYSELSKAKVLALDKFEKMR